MRLAELVRTYRRVFIIESRAWFTSCIAEYDATQDLVLTYDFGLKHDVTVRGGVALYIDHLVDPLRMQEDNLRIYDFFRTWHLDIDGNDLFNENGVQFGLAFRLEFWNDYVFYLRKRLCLNVVRQVKCESIWVGTESGLVEAILGRLDVDFTSVPRPETSAPAFYFPTHEWMKANIRRSGAKALIMNVASWTLGTLAILADRLSGATRRPAVFVQDYHPTRAVIERLRRDGRVRVVAADVTREHLWSRYVPLWGIPSLRRGRASRMMDGFRQRRFTRLVLSDGSDVTDEAYEIIEAKVAPRLPIVLHTLDAVARYLERNPIALEVMISNIGEFKTLVDRACRARGTPSFMIINGILGSDFLDEAKHASVINAYSPVIRKHYFGNADSVVCLGDPRMDSYTPLAQRRRVNSEVVRVTIGASGHNPTDLNSYVAVEFDFMHDVLTGLQRLLDRGVSLEIVIKVRPNGYATQYRQFADEYFPGLVTSIVDAAPMREVLHRSDFFISIYSQTLFEASCLGIPVLYYRADSEFKHPPFDGRSELVTVDTVDDLVTALEDFLRGSDRYDAFLRQEVMERYIGPLDGQNLERNVKFIYELLEQKERRVA